MSIFDKDDLAKEFIIDMLLDDIQDEIDSAKARIESAMAENLKPKNNVITGTFADGQKMQEIITIETKALQDKIEELMDGAFLDTDMTVSQFYKEMKVPANLTKDQELFLEALSNTAKNGMGTIPLSMADSIATAIYSFIMAGGDYPSLLSAVSIFYEGAGRDYDTNMRDVMRNYYQNVHLLHAKAAGLNEFLYVGNIMATSRPWCIVRAGRVFSEKTINSWAGDSWKGKSCHPMICRGGYNCRHHWRPVRKEWVDGGKVDVGSYFIENPDKMTDKIKSEVEAERKKLK